MSDVVDVIYRFRDMAGIAADDLRAEISKAQKVLDKLDKFADDAEHVGQLSASSARFPEHHAIIPRDAGMTKDRADDE